MRYVSAAEESLGQGYSVGIAQPRHRRKWKNRAERGLSRESDVFGQGIIGGVFSDNAKEAALRAKNPGSHRDVEGVMAKMLGARVGRLDTLLSKRDGEKKKR